jgi:pyruvate-formate lyase-activating enzyme
LELTEKAGEKIVLYFFIIIAGDAHNFEVKAFELEKHDIVTGRNEQKHVLYN